MKYGKLKVAINYGDGFTTENTYHAYSFNNEGTMVSACVDVNSVDHSAQIHYGVDVATSPQSIFGDADNITYTWVENPTITNMYLENGANLNNYRTPGVYCSKSVLSSTYTLSNTPSAIGTSAFVLEVLPLSTTGILQRVTRCHKTAMITAERMYYSGSWGNWSVTKVNSQKVLWSGTYYMTSDHKAILSENVSDQKNGIVLVFSAYENGAAVNGSFNFEFIPKKFVELQNGAGVSVFLNNPNLSKIGFKYLYVHNDKITGVTSNGNSGTSTSGITFDNNFYVLRYVLGV